MKGFQSVRSVIRREVDGTTHGARPENDGSLTGRSPTGSSVKLLLTARGAYHVMSLRSKSTIPFERFAQAEISATSEG